jgi:hypothetical protein
MVTVDRGNLHSIRVLKPEIIFAAWDTETYGMRWEFHAYFVTEGSKSRGPEGFRGFNVGDMD